MPHEIRLVPGGLDPDLCIAGIEQTERLARDLKLTGFERIYCSPAARTIQTAEILKETLGIEIKTCKNLTFVQLKEDRIQAFAKVVSKDPASWIRFWVSQNWPGLENPAEFLARIKSTLREIAKLKGKILLVAHAETIMALRAIAEEQPIKAVIGRKVEYATLYEFDIQEDAI